MRLQWKMVRCLNRIRVGKKTGFRELWSSVMRNRRFKVTDVAAPDKDNPPLRRNTQPSMGARTGSGSEDARLGTGGVRGGGSSHKRAWAMFILLVALAVLTGIAIALILPKISSSVASSTGANNPTGEAANILQTLAVREDSRSAGGYNRGLFGFRQTDDDGNGCDIREDVLARDLKDIKYKYAGSCKVSSGVLNDPYTGTVIYFRRGTKTSAAVQIDHVVALHNAWDSGASQWPSAKKYKFANDPYNLLAVEGQANQEKGDASADAWLPTNKGFRCEYVARQIGVKAKYSLTVTQAEKDVMMGTLRSCPAQKLP